MVFASLEFLTLFLPAFLLIYALGKPQWRNVILLIGSWLFYGWLNPMFLALHVALTIVAWVGGLRPLIAPQPFVVGGRVNAQGKAQVWAGNAQGIAQQGEVTFD